MRRILPLSLLLASLVSVVVLAGSCQTYDFEPVVPLAISQKTTSRHVEAVQLKPNLFLVVDSSGSMTGYIDPSCTMTGCPTRISDLKSAMHTFLTGNSTVARMGLTNFPRPAGADACMPASLADIRVPLGGGDDDATLRATATSIDNQIQALNASGGTPTAATLSALGSYEPLNDPLRSNFILLMTDGLPNCNNSNPNTCSDLAACRCTQPSCTTSLGTCTIGCLDKDATVSTITALRSKGISTIVVGFGSETGSGAGPEVLSAMALAGGFSRTCPNGTNAECGTGDTCNTSTKTCSRPFYQAANGAELGAALAKISESIITNPCEYILAEKPSDPRYLSVLVNGTAVTTGPNTWSYDPSSGKVTFLGDLCTQLKTSSKQSPVDIEFRSVQAL